MELKGKKLVIFIIAVAALFIFVITYYGSKASKIKPTENIYTQEHFNDMMHRDPSTWTSAEADMFDDFMEWSDNN